MWKRKPKEKKEYTAPLLLLKLSDKIRELDDKIIELEIKYMGLEKHARKLQDTLDHYGIRMSNKMPDENKYYKRWYK